MPRPSRSIALAALLGATLTTLTACGSSSPADDGSLRVVATTTQIADFARNVGGDRVSLTQMIPPNGDPHDFEPSPSDVEAVAGASVVLEHGIDLDAWLDGVISNAGGDATRAVVTTGITLRPGSDDEPAGDPHVWLDPRNAKTMVDNVAAALAAADPDGAETYRANAARYGAEIDALDAELLKRISTVPESQRSIVTDHDAFGYFADRYGITIVGTVIPSLSTSAEPSAKELADLVATIRSSGAKVVFSEASVDPKLEEAIAKEAGVTVGAPLFGDSLGPAGQPSGTYLGMMRTNMDAIIAGIIG